MRLESYDLLMLVRSESTSTILCIIQLTTEPL